MHFLLNRLFLCLLSGCCLISCSEQQMKIVGYVEGEYTLIAPLEVAQVKALEVLRGQRVDAGQNLAQMDPADAKLSVQQNTALLIKLNSELRDLQQGKRPEEIKSIEAARNSARAKLDDARRILAREDALLKTGQDSRANFDKAQTNMKVAEAFLQEMEANVIVAKLPAREDKINAAVAAVEQQQSALELARWRLGKRTITAEQNGIVFDIIRRQGEIAGPQAPILSLLADGSTKIRLYIPQRLLSGYQLGDQIKVECDSCDQSQHAIISYISESPEFTPPVIYSIESRQKLVYLIEARPEENSNFLKPGQIVNMLIEN